MDNSQLKSEIAELDIDFKLKRFDIALANAAAEDLPKLKKEDSFLVLTFIIAKIRFTNLKEHICKLIK